MVAVAAWALSRPAGPPRRASTASGGRRRAPEFATGFEAGGDRLVTVAHVLDAGPTVSVDGRRAVVLRIDRRDDLALLRVPGLNARSIRTGAGSIGPVALLARPARVRRALTAVVRPVRARPPPRWTSTRRWPPATPAHPVIGRDGRVVGVLFAASRERARTAYAVDGTACGALLRQTAPR